MKSEINGLILGVTVLSLSACSAMPKVGGDRPITGHTSCPELQQRLVRVNRYIRSAQKQQTASRAAAAGATVVDGILRHAGRSSPALKWIGGGLKVFSQVAGKTANIGLELAWKQRAALWAQYAARCR